MTDEQEWHNWRRAGIGASDVPGIMGVSPYSSPWSIWATKVGLTQGPAETDAMRFGRDLEPIIARWFTDATDLFVHGEQTMCIHSDESWARATVDGFVCESGTDDIDLALGVYEAKFTGQGGDELAEHYAMQCQWQMFVTGTDHAWVAVMSLAFGRPRLTVHELARDDNVIARCVAVCREFWESNVLTGTPPPADATRATTEAIVEAYGGRAHADGSVALDDIANLIDRLGRAKENQRQLKRDVDELENTIKARLGVATAGTIDDEIAVTWREQSTKRLDAKALRAAEPDLADKFTTESTFRVLRLKGAG